MAVSSRAVRLVLVTCLLHNATSSGQRLPSRDESTFLLQSRHPEIFYDTKAIPDGAEVTAYLLKNVTSRFFFTVEETGVPLAIMVSPCASPIDVRIAYQDIPADETYEDYDEGDYGYYSNGNGQNISNKDSMFHQTSSDGNRYDVTEVPETVLIVSTGSEEAVNFEVQSAASGLYSIIVTVIDRDSSLKLYATTAPHIDSSSSMTSHPVEKTISVVRALPNEISFVWRPTDLPSFYCLAINQLRHFRTRCAAIGFLDGDPEPTIPPNAGFGFSWEKEAARRRRERAKQRAASAARGKDKRHQVLSYTCVGAATNYTYRNVTPGSRYFIDVYAVSGSTNVSRYHGRINVSTPLTSSSIKAGRISEGREARILLTAKHPTKWFEYTLRDQHRRNTSYNISLYFRSCTIGTEALKVVVERRQGGRSQQGLQQLMSSVITESYQTLSFSGLKPGSFRVRTDIDVASNSSNGELRRVQSRWTLMMVANAFDDPYPLLPRNLTIWIVDDNENSTRECRRSVTLAWILAEVRPTQRYCVYATELTSSTLNDEQPDTCADPRRRTSAIARKTNKIACKVVSGTNIGVDAGSQPQRPSDVEDGTEAGSGRQSLMIQTVSGLKLGRRYAFDVQTTRVPDDTSSGTGHHFRVYNRLVTSLTTSGCSPVSEFSGP